MSTEETTNRTVVNEYDIHNESMFGHLTVHGNKRPWWRKLQSKVSAYFDIRIRDRWYDVKRYVKNRFRFDKVLREWMPWDYNSQVNLFAFGLEQLANYIEKYGNEVESSRNKKIAAIRELVTLLRKDYEDEVHEKFFTAEDYRSSYRVTEYADGSVGFKDISPEEKQQAHTEKMNQFNKALQEAKEQHYDRIFRIIRGQSNTEFEKLYDEAIEKLPEEQREDWNVKMSIRDEISDGTGIESWWD